MLNIVLNIVFNIILNIALSYAITDRTSALTFRFTDGPPNGLRRQHLPEQ
jgi:hypothetical protein